MSQPTQPAQVQEKSPKPQGLLPKNVQSWLLIGLAFLMVAIMWLTGGKSPRLRRRRPRPHHRHWRRLKSTKPKSASCKTASSNCSAIKWSLRTLSRQQTRLLGGVHKIRSKPSSRARPVTRPNSEPKTPSRRSASGVRYVSLFASNVALTYRKTPSTPPTRDSSLRPKPLLPPRASFPWDPTPHRSRNF